MLTRAEALSRVEDSLRERVKNRNLHIVDYLEASLANPNISPGSIRTYLGAILGFDDFLSDSSSHGIELTTGDEIVSYFQDLQSKKDDQGKSVQLSYARLSSIWCALNSFFNFLVERKIRPDNPVKVIKKPSQAKDKPKRYFFTPDELKLLMATSKKQIDEQTAPRKWAGAIRNHAILTLLCYAGMRIQAVLNIDLTDVDWESRTIQIAEKRDHQYTYYMTKDVYQSLKNWADVRHILAREWIDTPALFLGQTGKRLPSQTFSLWLQKLEVCLVSGKHLAPHKLRASFATNMLETTKDIHMVKEMMHHSSISTTQLYIPSHRDADRKAAEIMEDILGDGADEINQDHVS